MNPFHGWDTEFNVLRVRKLVSELLKYEEFGEEFYAF